MTEKLKKWMEQIEAQQDRTLICVEQLDFLMELQRIRLLSLNSNPKKEV